MRRLTKEDWHYYALSTVDLTQATAQSLMKQGKAVWGLFIQSSQQAAIVPYPTLNSLKRQMVSFMTVVAMTLTWY